MELVFLYSVEFACRLSTAARSFDKLFGILFQRDPADEDVPYCTLKSFPAQIEHCIQWARDKVTVLGLLTGGL